MFNKNVLILKVFFTKGATIVCQLCNFILVVRLWLQFEEGSIN